MSKYIYTTIYEQFTGLKPPEPKNHKPRRRRGYGHPYRMRLNMQDDAQTEEGAVDNEVDDELDQQPQSLLKPSVDTPIVRKASIHRVPRPRSSLPTPVAHSMQSNAMQNNPMMSEGIPKNDPAPKVTYKKRRQYSEPVISPSMAD